MMDNRMPTAALVLLLCAGAFLPARSQEKDHAGYARRIEAAVAEGKLAFRLTERSEIEALFGPPMKIQERRDGGMLDLEMSYPHFSFLLGKMRDDESPFTLRRLFLEGRELDIGREKKLVLRGSHDLNKIDRFNGFQNVSLIHLDLRKETELLESTLFDSLTEWPPRDKLPETFHPRERLEEGKRRGLGLNVLHDREIDGRGVGIAIIDQPLLLGHREYTSALVRYDATGLPFFPPQMHGSPIASIAVGSTIGVAPGSSLTYFAVPMWEQNNRPFTRALNTIIDLNERIPEGERIRVVSISTGMFSHWPEYDEWKLALSRAEEKGILVVTCDPEFLTYGTLSRRAGADPDDPRSYKKGLYTRAEDRIRIPTGGITLASHRGTDVYVYEVDGGMSWAAPYIAGLAALAFQIKPDSAPREIIDRLLDTVTRTEAGPIVNPVGFIESSSR